MRANFHSPSNLCYPSQMKFLLPFIILILSFSAFGQRKPVKKITVPKDSVLSGVLNSLAKPEICGSSDSGEQTTFSGSIVKREFNRRRQMSGFVIADSKRRRTHVSLYADHIDGLADSASRELANFLINGRRIKVRAFRCAHIFYASEIAPF